MRDVTVGGPGLVAVGYDNAKLSVWTSDDGLTWNRIPQDQEELGGGEIVTVGGPGLVENIK